jgi:hypothetical protein
MRGRLSHARDRLIVAKVGCGLGLLVECPNDRVQVIKSRVASRLSVVRRVY